MFVIENPENGERQCVKGSLDGYDGWRVLEERTARPPQHAQWVEGQGFVVDEVKRDAFKEEARLNTISRLELADELRAEIRAEMTAVRAEVAALKGPSNA